MRVASHSANLLPATNLGSKQLLRVLPRRREAASRHSPAQQLPPSPKGLTYMLGGELTGCEPRCHKRCASRCGSRALAVAAAQQPLRLACTKEARNRRGSLEGLSAYGDVGHLCELGESGVKTSAVPILRRWSQAHPRQPESESVADRPDGDADGAPLHLGHLRPLDDPFHECCDGSVDHKVVEAQ